MITTSRVVLKAAGMNVSQFTQVSIKRDLQDIAGSFDVTVYDQARANQAGVLAQNYGGISGITQPLVCGMPCQMLIDGQIVLDGYIEDVTTQWAADRLGTRIMGRDKTGDLVDCAAAPNGPAEFKNVGLLYIASMLCEPFHIPVRADIDLGAAFTRLAIGPHEKVLAAIEKGARQRSTLVTSDGVGGLLLTRGGSTRAPGPLEIGTNVLVSDITRSWRERFSDVYVKGQTERAGGARVGVPVYLDSSISPLTGGAVAPPVRIAPESTAILMTGHATDPEITRYRPAVRLTRSQSGMSTTQEQAAWAVRVARGHGDRLEFTVLDWRTNPDGPTGKLWLPNQVAAVYEPFAGLNQDMLIAGVHYQFSEAGLTTILRMVGVTAYDLINEAEKKRPRLQGRGKTSLDATPAPFTAP